MSEDILLSDLRNQIGQRPPKVIAIIGAGVAQGATLNQDPVAGWSGLLRDGISRAEEVGLPKLAGAAAKRQREALDGSELDEWLNVAELVQTRLKDADEYRSWLRETVGRLEARDRSVINALHSLNIPLVTTNYDSLLCAGSDLRPVALADSGRALRLLRGEETGVLHLHGHWDAPDTVVLGIRDYERHLHDAGAQFLQQAMAAFNSFLFIGCGAGLRDPNFSKLFQWISRLNGDHRHFRLCRDEEVQELETERKNGARVFPLPYGPNHAGLAPFLRGLKQRSNRDGGDDVKAEQFLAEVKRRIAEALHGSAKATAGLAERLNLNLNGIGSAGAAEAVAEALVLGDIGRGFGVLKEARTKFDGPSRESWSAVNAVDGVIRALVHVIYSEEEIEPLRAQGGMSGIVIEIPAASFTFAALCMARLHRHMTRMREPSREDRPREWPFGVNEIEFPPETGDGKGFSGFEAAFDLHLVTRFAKAKDRRDWADTSLSAERRAAIVTEVRETLQAIDQYKTIGEREGPLCFIPGKLDTVIHPVDRQVFDDMLMRLAGKWPEIVFVRLSDDPGRSRREKDLLWAIRHVLWQESGRP